MKKTLLVFTLILSMLLCAVPVIALELDTAEAAVEVPVSESVLLADPGIETTHEDYGTLIYYEDFEDQSTSSWYGENAKNAYMQSSVQNLICASPDGNGYVADFGYYNTFHVTYANNAHYHELTIVADVYSKPDVTLSNIGYYDGSTWYEAKSSVKNAETWTTISYTMLNVSATANFTTTFALNQTTNYYVDNVRVYVKTEADTGVYAQKPADRVPVYGNLVYYDNFSGNTGFTNKADIKITGLSSTSVVKSGYNAVVANNTCSTLPSNVRGVVVEAGENGFTYTDGTPLKGTLAIYGELYVLKNNGTYLVINKEAASTLSNTWSWAGNMYVGGGKNKTINPQNFKWTTGYSHTQPITAELTKFGVSAQKTDTYWAFRSIAVYFMPEDKVTLVNGGKTEYVDLNCIGNSFVLPEITGDNAYLAYWADETGNRYNPGTEFASEDVNGKTFSAFKVTVPLLDENLGELVIFHGFEGAEKEDIEYFNNNIISNAEFSIGDGLAFNTFALVDDYDGSENQVLEMTLKENVSWTISGFQYNLGDRKFVPEEGKFSEFIDIYNRNEGSALSRDSLYSVDYNAGESFGTWSQMRDITFAPGTWVKNVAFAPMTIVKNTDEETIDVAKLVIKWGDDAYQKRSMNELRYIQHRFTGSGQTSVSVDNYRLYFYPANAFMVKDSGALVMEKGAEDGTYTFKALSELFNGEYAENACYTDGKNKYYAGQTVEISRIAGKTLTVEYVAPENSGKAEIRVSNIGNNNGIRFMASITASLKAQVNEYGFVVAREDVLTALGKDLTFDLGGEGSVYVKGAAYKLDENGDAVVDKVYSDNEDGSMNFTGVCVGFDIADKFKVTSNLVARPYMVYKRADGSEFVVYGAKHTESLAGVAVALKTAAEDGNEAAVSAYERANYEGGNSIDDIIRTAYN